MLTTLRLIIWLFSVDYSLILPNQLLVFHNSTRNSLYILRFLSPAPRGGSRRIWYNDVIRKWVISVGCQISLFSLYFPPTIIDHTRIMRGYTSLCYTSGTVSLMQSIAGTGERARQLSFATYVLLTVPFIYRVLQIDRTRTRPRCPQLRARARSGVVTNFGAGF